MMPNISLLSLMLLRNQTLGHENLALSKDFSINTVNTNTLLLNQAISNYVQNLARASMVLPQVSLPQNNAVNSVIQAQLSAAVIKPTIRQELKSESPIETPQTASRDSEDFKPQSQKLNNLVIDLAIKCKKDWKKVSSRLKNITNQTYSPTYIKNLYKYLDASQAKRIKFSDEDDESLVKCVNENGMDWVKVAESFPGRCPLSLRNRYYRLKKELQSSKKKLNTKSKQKLLIDEDQEEEEEL